MTRTTLIAGLAAVVALLSAANMVLAEMRVSASGTTHYACGFLAGAEMFAAGKPKLPEYCVSYRDEAAAGGFDPK